MININVNQRKVEKLTKRAAELYKQERREDAKPHQIKEPLADNDMQYYFLAALVEDLYPPKKDGDK